MPEIQNYTFSFKEVAEALVKQQGLHEGLWGIYVEFGFAAANINTTPDASSITPAAIVPIQKIGIQRFDAASNLTVDAAVVNPDPNAASTRSKRAVESVKTVGTTSTARMGSMEPREGS